MSSKCFDFNVYKQANINIVTTAWTRCRDMYICKIIISSIKWFIYNFGLMGPGTRCFPYQWSNCKCMSPEDFFHNKFAIPLHPGTL